MKSTTRSRPSATKAASNAKKGTVRTLAIDIGGSGIKASVLDDSGQMLTERVRVETPKPCPPQVAVEAISGLVASLPSFDRISVGFPGVVRHGRVLTAVNLGDEDWRGFDLANALEETLRKPARLLNDADMQGFAAIEGKGVELVVTLGTGVGTAIFEDGRLGPHLEIAHHILWKGKTYEEYVGNAARQAVGNKKWNNRLKRVIRSLRRLTYFDKLHLGGGNAKKVTIELDPDVRIVSNTAGILGGIALWR
ncbi:MAG: ROK family protein [Candidatus Wallbacteria bacterium]|nr:ROK family protein [Candidatus Wallbacteria bacterium]